MRGVLENYDTKFSPPRDDGFTNAAIARDVFGRAGVRPTAEDIAAAYDALLHPPTAPRRKRGGIVERALNIATSARGKK